MIICCGEALIDMVPERDPQGRELFAPCFGGSPYNTAIAAGRLLGREKTGPRTAFLARLSRDFFGQALVDHLEQNHVSTDLVVRSGETTTLAFVKLDQGKEPAYIFYTLGAADRSLAMADLPPALPPGANCLAFGSISMTMESSASTIEQLVLRERGRENGPVISHDPNVRPILIEDRDAYVRRFEGWVRASQILKISAADFDFIYPGLGLEPAVEKLLSMGPCLVAVTLGSQGAMGVLKQEGGGFIKIFSPAPELPVIDTIGAGDTFHGALLAWLEINGRMSPGAIPRLKDRELREALDFSNKAAAIVCSRKGANPPALAELKA
ncbi:MAG: carbohydrate kinase [Spirochaetaceae bacterium]|jgi:fructokinase|nr:carbohydrate kinase [Spirochaetaceae bacterium]